MNEPKQKAAAPAPAEIERRLFLGKVELRAPADGSTSPGTLLGYGAVFNQLSVDMGGWREKLAPGCFAARYGDDVRGLFNHEPDNLLGRSTAGTLRFIEDDHGLRSEIDLANTQCGRDTAELVRRGDMTGMSFSFTVDSGMDEWDWSGDTPVRTVRAISKLYDLGPVTFPAYEGTACQMRSAPPGLEAARTKRAHQLLELEQDKARMSLARARQALSEIALG
jgi:HK97 family phage prohead protease